MRRRFKSKKRFDFKFITYFILFVFLIFMLSIYVKKINFLTSNDKFINAILSDINNKNIANIIKFIDKNIFNSPIYLLESELNYKKSNNNAYFAYVEVDKPIVYITSSKMILEVISDSI